jgi:hypothetical protein
MRRPRRTKKEIADLKQAIFNVIAADHPVTVRGVFYRLVSMGHGLIEKTESEYDHTVGRLLIALRREGVVPWEWIADTTRWVRKPQTYSSAQAMLQEVAQLYRRDLWLDQSHYVEVWTEKDAIAALLYEETSAWHVPLMVVRGFSSLTFLRRVARDIAEQIEQGRAAHLYFLGDHDPSGLRIAVQIERELRRFVPDFTERGAFEFTRLALARTPLKATIRPHSICMHTLGMPPLGLSIKVASGQVYPNCFSGYPCMPPSNGGSARRFLVPLRNSVSGLLGRA